MTNNGKEGELESIRQASVFIRQTIRLHLLELATKAAQEGTDLSAILKGLSSAAAKASGNPLDLPISELEVALFSALEARQNFPLTTLTIRNTHDQQQ